MTPLEARAKRLAKEAKKGTRRLGLVPDPLKPPTPPPKPRTLLDELFPQPPTDDGGGLLGKVLNNPVTKTLGLLDVPRRAIISGMQEAADAFGPGDASFGDFKDQVADKQYGFGTAMGDTTGNKWLDRGIGFVGDVALDPLTYLTFGVGSFAGSAGRIAAATRVAEAGLDASKVGRLGAIAAKGAEREAIYGATKQAGLRFAGARIPGTGKLAETVGEGLGRTRAKIGDIIPQGVRDARLPKGYESHYRTIRNGTGETNDALRFIARGGAEAAFDGRFVAPFVGRADKLSHQIKKSGEGQAIFTALDEGLPLSSALGDEAFAFFNDSHAAAVKQLGTKLVDGVLVSVLGKRADYAPHIVTAEFLEATRDPVFGDVRRLIGIDKTAATGGAISRNIHPDGVLTMPDGQVIKWVADTTHNAVSARQVNEKLGGALGGIKVFEDDITRVFQPHVQGLGSTVGRAEGLRRLAQIPDNALNELTEQPLRPGFTQVKDDVATARADKQTRKGVSREGDANAANIANVVKQLGKGGAQVKKDAIAGFEKQLAASGDELTKALADEARAKRVATGLNTTRAQVSSEVQQRVSAATKQFDALSLEQTALHERGVLKNNPGAARAQALKPQAAIDERRAALIAEMSDAQQAALKRYDQIDAAKQAARTAQMDARDYAAMARDDIAKIKAAMVSAKRLNVSPTTKSPNAALKAYAKVEQELDAVSKAAGTQRHDTTRSLMSWYAKGVAELREGKELDDGLALLGKALKTAGGRDVLKTVVRDGWEQIGRDLLGDEAPIVRRELARQITDLQTAIDDPGFFKVVDGYTRFFKTYATATIGFHVRNAMSATFMNATDGVSVRNMSRGASLWKQFDKAPDTFLDDLPDWITREQADAALLAVFGSGGGQGQFGKAEIRLGDSKWTNNAYTRLSQRIGGKVEGVVRMGMAVDSVLAGATWDEAAARVSRIHFDYSQVSKFDASMKRLIPFWTFLSRNVPLQMQQMFLRPQMYQSYAALQRNMGQDEGDSMIPLSWRESGAFQLTDGIWAAPDLPHVRFEDDLSKLTTDPLRLLESANPLLKVPLETMVADKKLYSDMPFRDNQFKELDGGLALLGPLLKILGQTETAGDGSTVIDEKLAYAITNLLPPVAQSQRLTGQDEYTSGRRAQSILGNLGIPLKLLTPQVQESERKRRERLIGDPKGDARRKALATFASK